MVLIQPEHYRPVDKKLAADFPGSSVEVVNVAVQAQGEAVLDMPSASDQAASASAAAASAPAPVAPKPAGARRLGCNSCGGVSFDTPAEHREHFKSEWHRINLKRKVDGLEPLDESTFEQLQLMDPGTTSTDFF